MLFEKLERMVVRVRKELKNRIKIALIFGAIALLSLINVWGFGVFLLAVYAISFSEIKSVVGNKIENKTSLLILSFFISLYLLFGITSTFFLRMFFLLGLFFAILGTVANDTIAYFVGKKFGKRKLAPSISSKKTVEGALGGIAGTIVFSLLFGSVLMFIADVSFKFSDLIILGAVIGFFGIIGDLLESLFKRKFGVKDSGGLLGEHGGLLDRLDSHLLAIPTTFIYLFLTGYFQLK